MLGCVLVWKKIRSCSQAYSQDCMRKNSPRNARRYQPTSSVAVLAMVWRSLRAGRVSPEEPFSARRCIASQPRSTPSGAPAMYEKSPARRIRDLRRLQPGLLDQEADTVRSNRGECGVGRRIVAMRDHRFQHGKSLGGPRQVQENGAHERADAVVDRELPALR